MAEEYGRLPEEEVLGQIPGLMDGALKEAGVASEEPQITELYRAVSLLRQAVPVALRLEVDRLIETSEHALYQAKKCEFGKMVDALKEVGFARTMLRIKGFSEKKLEKPYSPADEQVFGFTDGTLTKLIKEALSECGCKGK